MRVVSNGKPENPREHVSRAGYQLVAYDMGSGRTLIADTVCAAIINETGEIPRAEKEVIFTYCALGESEETISVSLVGDDSEVRGYYYFL